MIDRFLKFLLRLLPQGGGMAPLMEQEHFRVRNDTTAATSGGTPNWISTEDQATNIVVDPGQTFRIRFVAANSGTAQSSNLQQLYVSKNGGAYVFLGSQTDIEADAAASSSSSGTTLTATTDFLLTAGTGTAIDGDYQEFGSTGLRIADGEYTEIEFGLIVNNGLVAGDEYSFRLYDNGTAYDNFDFTPTIEVGTTVRAAATISLEGSLVATPGWGPYGTPRQVQTLNDLVSEVTIPFQTAVSGNLLVLHAAMLNGSASPTTPTGWSQAVLRNPTTSAITNVLYYKVSDGTETTVTLTLNGTYNVGSGVVEYWGPFDSSPLDKTASADGNSQTPTSGTTAAQTQTDNLAVALLSTSGAYSMGSYTNGYTSVGIPFVSTNIRDNEVYKHLTDAAATSVDASIPSGTQQWTGVIATFKEQGVASASATCTLSGSIPVAVGSGGADGTLRQNKTFGVFTPSGPQTVNLGSACQSGALIVVNACCDRSGATISATGFTTAVSKDDATNGQTNALLWKVSDGTETSVSISTTGSPDTFQGSVVEYNGSYQSSPVDQTASNSGNDTSQPSGTTAAQSVSGNLAVAAHYTDGIYGLSSWSNSYTEKNQIVNALDRAHHVSRVLADALATSTTPTGIATAQKFCNCIATFKFAVSGTVTATATITLSGDQAGDGKSRAFATSTSSGDLAAIGSIVPLSAAATVTMSGDQAGVGTSRAFATSTMTGDLVASGTGFVYALATITMTGDVVANGTTMARATITALGDNGSLATNLGAATIDFIGTLIAGGGTQFATATSTLSGDLVTGGGQHSALATSTSSGDLAGTAKNLTAATSTSSGDLVATAKTLASATSSLAGDLAAIGTNLSSGVVNAAATISMAGDLVAVGTSRAAATSTLTGDLVATAITRATATSTLAGELAGVGTHMARATITALGDNGSLATLLASSTITLPGDLVASGTGFVYALATSTLSGNLASAGRQVVSATITVSGALTAGGGTQFALATATLSGTVAAIGTDITSGQVTALATITASGEVAASGTQRASGTISAAGDLVAATGITLASATINLLGEVIGESIEGVEGRDSSWLTATTNASKFDFGLGDYTVEFLYRSPRLGIGSNAIILDQRAATGEGWQITQSGSNHLSARISDGTITRSVIALNVIFDDEDIHHCAVIFDRTSDNLEIFVDGTSRASNTYSIIGSLTSGEDFRILGKDGEQSWRYGLLSEIRVWNDIRTLQEIQDNRDVKMVGNEANLIALYPCSKGPHGVPLTEIGTDNHLEDLCASPAHAGWQEHLTTFFTKTRTDNNRIQWVNPVVAPPRPKAQSTLRGAVTAQGNVFIASATINLNGDLVSGGGTQFATATATLSGNLAAVGTDIAPSLVNYDFLAATNFTKDTNSSTTVWLRHVEILKDDLADQDVEYLVLATAYWGSNTNPDGAGHKIGVHSENGLRATGSTALIESSAVVGNFTGDAYGYSNYFQYDTAEPAGEGWGIEIQAPNLSNVTAVTGGVVAALGIKDITHVKDRDVFFNARTSTSDTWVSSNTSVTIGDGVKDYLLIAHVMFDDIDALTLHHMAVFDGTTRTELSNIQTADLTDQPVLLAGHIAQAPAASTTFTLQLKQTTVNVDGSRPYFTYLIAIPLDDLAAAEWAYAADPADPASAAEYAPLSLNFTAQETGDYIFIGGLRESWSGSSNSGGTEIDVSVAGGADTVAAGNKSFAFTAQNAANDYFKMLVPHTRIAIESGQSIAVNLRHTPASTFASNTVKNAFLVGFRVSGSAPPVVPVLAAATVSLSGDLQVGGGRFSATSFIPLSGALVAQGQKLILAAGTISMSGDLLPAVGISFCAVRPTATIGMAGTLTAFEDPANDIVTASAGISLTGLVNAFLRHYASGGNFLAHASVGLSGQLDADVRKVTCITPTASINCAGATLSIGFTDPNKFFKSATITMGGEIGSLALAYPASATVDLGGDLTVVGRNIDEGTLTLAVDRFTSNIQVLSGPATIDGQRSAVLRTSFGSLQIYNNGRGGFYTIGASGALKEAYSTSIFGGLLTARGEADLIKSRTAKIYMTPILSNLLTANGRTNLPTTLILGNGLLAAKGDHALVTATATMSGTLAAVGVQPPLEFNLNNRAVNDTQYNSQLSQVEYRINNNGFIETYKTDDGFFKTVEQWVDPASAGSDFDDPIYVRATRLSGVVPIGSSLDTWHKLPDGDESWLVQASGGQGVRSSQLFLELSRDFGTTIDDSATITLNARSYTDQPP